MLYLMIMLWDCNWNWKVGKCALCTISVNQNLDSKTFLLCFFFFFLPQFCILIPKITYYFYEAYNFSMHQFYIKLLIVICIICKLLIIFHLFILLFFPFSVTVKFFTIFFLCSILLRIKYIRYMKVISIKFIILVCKYSWTRDIRNPQL